MKCIVGLGNPGRKYEHTRHNVGFLTVRQLAEESGIGLSQKGFSSIYGRGLWEGQKVLFLLPMTYMNLSGHAVREAVEYYKIDLSDLLVVYDDLHLPLGRLRFRSQGSSGGQKGMESIIEQLGSSHFPRLRIGVGPVPAGVKWETFVLSPFSPEERSLVSEVVQVAIKGIRTWLLEGVEAAMQTFNGMEIAKQ